MPETDPSRPLRRRPVRDPVLATVALALVVLLTLALVAAVPAQAQTRTETRAPGTRAEAAREYFTDVELVNQHGETMRLYSDLIAGKIVLINSMFTTCTGICPLMSKKLETIQEHVGDRLGDDVHLISITVDPETDTPEKMQAFAERFHAKPGWYFLTGEPENVEAALKKLGQFVEDPDNHQGILIMGNTRTGLWKKAFGLADVDELVALFDSVLLDSPPTGGTTGEAAAGARSGS